MKAKHYVLGGIALAALVCFGAVAVLRSPQNGGARYPVRAAVMGEASAETVGASGGSSIADFEDCYARWKEYCEELGPHPDVMKRLDCEYYRQILAMGPAVLPLIVEKRRSDPDFQLIGWAWGEVARVWPDPNIYPWARESVLDWWEGGQEQANERFEGLYAELKQYRAEGREAAAIARTIRALGIVALPPMIEKVRQGDTAMLEIVRDLTRGAADTSGATGQEQAEACLAWWQQNKDKWLIPFDD